MEEQATTPEQDTIPEVVNEESTEETTPGIRVKYNGEEKEIPLDEAVVLAQKGMNYDKVNQSLDSYKSKDPLIKFVEGEAKRYNLTTEAYLQKVAESKKQEEQNKLIEQGVPKQYAEQVQKQETELREIKAELAEARKAKESQDMYKKFIAKFPDADTKNLPDSVLAAEDMIGAYQEHRYNELEGEIKALKNQSEGEEASTGSIKGTGSKENRVYDRESLKKMTIQERAKALPEIMKQLRKSGIQK